MSDGKVSTRERVAAAWRRFYDWKTEHQFLGRYSVDKLQQFDRYQANAGVVRCLVVITLRSMLPVFALLVGLHAIPVASPELGLQHNVGAAVRSAIGYAVFTTTWVFFMMHSLGTTSDSPPLKTVTLSVLAGGIVPEGLSAAVSFLWRYPVPGIGVVKLAISLVGIVLVTRFSQTKESRAMNRQRTRILAIVMAQYLLIVVFYMLLALGFSKAPWGLQLSLAVIQLPLRSFLKRQSWVYARKLSDLSSDVTLNIVDFSASIYLALCILYAHNAKPAALIVIGEFLLGIAVARTYSVHTFIVDGYRTLQTALKIVEGSLASTLVVEEEEEEAPKETLPSPEGPADAMTSTEVQAQQTPKSAQRLRRSSSDTAANSRGSIRRSSGPTEVTTAIDTDHQAAKCFPTVVRKLQRVWSDPVPAKAGPARSHPSVVNESSIAEESRKVLKTDQNSRGEPAAKASQETKAPKQDRLHRRMSEAAGVDSARHDPPLTAKYVQLLRRTASDTIPEQPTQKSGSRDATGGRRTSRTNDLRLQSWARDPAKVYCSTDIRPESASSPPSPKQKRPPQQRRSSMDLPPLADLQSADFGGRPPLRRSASVFLTPRTFMKHGSKRLLDLGRSSGRAAGNAHPGAGGAAQKTSPSDARRPTQVSIDGMLVVRKDQARILEQTLQLLFSCEVVVVAEFVKVLVPFVLGKWG
jgi:hypothetical protein